MRILYYFPERSTLMFQWQHVHFLDELPRYGIDIEIFNPLLYRNEDEANEKVIEKLGSGKYELFFTNLCSPRIIYKETLLRVKEMGIPTLSFRGDNLKWALHDKELSPFFDLIWLSARDTRRFYDKWGCNVITAPYAANPYRFSYHSCQYESKVCFIGNPYGSRPIMINNLTNNSVLVDVFNIPISPDKLPALDLIDNKFDMASFGSFDTILKRFFFSEGRKLLLGSIINKISNPKKLIDSQYLNFKSQVLPQEQSQYYSTYRLALSSTSTGNTDVLRNPLSEINLRNFEIPMSGGIQICKFNPELAEYFEDGKEIVFYRSNEELVDKAKYYLKASESEIRLIKQAARKRAENEHTWMNRFKLAFDTLGLKY